MIKRHSIKIKGCKMYEILYNIGKWTIDYLKVFCTTF